MNSPARMQIFPSFRKLPLLSDGLGLEIQGPMLELEGTTLPRLWRMPLGSSSGSGRYHHRSPGKAARQNPKSCGPTVQDTEINLVIIGLPWPILEFHKLYRRTKGPCLRAPRHVGSSSIRMKIISSTPEGLDAERQTGANTVEGRRFHNYSLTFASDPPDLGQTSVHVLLVHAQTPGVLHGP